MSYYSTLKKGRSNGKIKAIFLKLIIISSFCVKLFDK